MGAQRLDARIVARQFGLGERGMNLVVTDLVQQHDRTALAPLEARHEVVKALAHHRRDRAQAERAYRVVRQFSLILSLAAGKRMPRIGEKARDA